MTINVEVVPKSALRGFKLGIRRNLDCVLLVHKSEGRLFLTDRNGFYNELL